MEDHIQHFEETYSYEIDQDYARGEAIRKRLMKPLGVSNEKSVGVTVESYGLGNLRVNMSIDKMEKIVDYYESELERVYSALDNR